jgi:predicted hotdog family 3-hydroxylacyl-ACP dehydratase
MPLPAPSPPLAELVPHRGPMRLLDEVVSHGERRIECRTTIRGDHAFLQDGKVESVVCVELVAQAVAAYVGYQDWLAQRKPQLGFIVSCREATFEAPFLSPGDTLTVEASHTWGESHAGSFKGRVSREGVTIAHVELGVYRGPLGAEVETAHQGSPSETARQAE